MTKRFSIKRAKKYTSNGVEKTAWLDVGTIVQFEDGKMSIELNHTSEKFFVFEQKKEAENKSQVVEATPEEVVNIPF